MEEKKFTKEDIKAGYVVQLRDGEYRLVVPVEADGRLIVTGSSWSYLTDYDINLKRIGEYSVLADAMLTMPDFDIMKVFGYKYRACCYKKFTLDSTDRPLLWERKESKKMTVAEIEKELGYSVEIVAEK